MEHAASYMTLAEMQRLAKLPVNKALAKQRTIQSAIQSLRVEGYIICGSEEPHAEAKLLLSYEQAEAAFDKVFGNKE